MAILLDISDSQKRIKMPLAFKECSQIVILSDNLVFILRFTHLLFGFFIILVGFVINQFPFSLKVIRRIKQIMANIIASKDPI